ncbi:2TM domain-containing protein [Tenacibaculum sp. M341]|uniref:2TM domain-containing protein n=1 Tax=Tenacibaculum sp. M341 TaxID=2530339 RepID=UPI001052AD08|nr:2TM domain-containing protein [Tenacibaculum sp. M341]TCI90562.1 2TM domain-containing protein [Tenacibaculum sp. M341]
MNVNSVHEARYFRAVKKVKAIKSVYAHIVVYLLVVSMLIYVNLKFTPHFHWFWFSALGWGMGLLSHIFQVFEWYKIFLGKDWEERKVKELMNKNYNDGK